VAEVGGDDLLEDLGPRAGPQVGVEDLDLDGAVVAGGLDTGPEVPVIDGAIAG
jgi:hypothetical protein